VEKTNAIADIVDRQVYDALRAWIEADVLSLGTDASSVHSDDPWKKRRIRFKRSQNKYGFRCMLSASDPL
jgi:hypothetical protein